MGGIRKHEIRTDHCSERRVEPQFQGVSVHPRILERRNGRARGIYNRLMSVDRFQRRQIPSEVQWCLNALMLAGEFSVYQTVFGPNTVDLFGRDAGDGDFLCVQDPSLSG